MSPNDSSDETKGGRYSQSTKDFIVRQHREEIVRRYAMFCDGSLPRNTCNSRLEALGGNARHGSLLNLLGFTLRHKPAT